MATCWSVEEENLFDRDEATTATRVLPLDDVEPAAASAATTPYLLDYSLMAIVLAILLFLWMQ